MNICETCASSPCQCRSELMRAKRNIQELKHELTNLENWQRLLEISLDRQKNEGVPQ